MKNVLTLLFLITFSAIINAQSFQSLDSIKAPENLENVHVVKVDSDSLASSFIIFIKHKVRKHKHEFHSEHVYVLEGEGEMLLGEKTMTIKKGDIIFIPKNTPHAVTVTSETVLKVLSVQAPKFEGMDRVFVD